MKCDNPGCNYELTDAPPLVKEQSVRNLALIMELILKDVGFEVGIGYTGS